MSINLCLAYGHETELKEASKVEKIQVYPELTKKHPPTTHFAIGFPIILLAIQILYLILKRKPDIVEFVILIASVLGVWLATATGLYVYYNMQEPTIKEAYEALEKHELLGILLSIIFLVLLALRITYELIKDEKYKSLIRWAYVGIIFISVLLLFYQGYLGGVMVYEYGVGIIYQYVM
ncbi:MAG: DUF2231 domain-containing protein [Brevinematia bacterium]